METPGVTRNRAEYPDYIAMPLAVHDVNIRILSDLALIHARSTHTTLADGVDQEAPAPGAQPTPARKISGIGTGVVRIPADRDLVTSLARPVSGRRNTSRGLH